MSNEKLNEWIAVNVMGWKLVELVVAYHQIGGGEPAPAWVDKNKDVDVDNWKDDDVEAWGWDFFPTTDHNHAFKALLRAHEERKYAFEVFHDFCTAGVRLFDMMIDKPVDTRGAPLTDSIPLAISLALKEAYSNE